MVIKDIIIGGVYENRYSFFIARPLVLIREDIKYHYYVLSNGLYYKNKCIRCSIDTFLERYHRVPDIKAKLKYKVIERGRDED